MLATLAPTASTDGDARQRIPTKGFGSARLKQVRDETAEIASDAARVLANSQSGGFVVDDPDTHDWVVAREVGQGSNRLINEPLLAIIAAAGFHRHAIFNEGDVAAFAAELRFFYKVVAKNISPS